MSPLSLRRYRAERLLRQEFQGLRERVLASVRARLGASGASLDQGDLEACYAQAWQGLYTATLEGQEIVNPAGWLVLVTFRRAVDELRAHGRSNCGIQVEDRVTEAQGAGEHDFDAELDDRMQLQQLFEGLRGRLDGREREAATLCYLQGLSRSEAATRMGVSEARMRKLMEGRGTGRPGVAGKVGALVQTISEGDWCAEQASLMRALAYGILDPDGERYRLALMHHRQCPACRAYVVSLRGLAAALPPVLLPWSLGAAVLVRAGEAAHASGVAGAASGGAPGGASGAGLQAGRGIGGAVSASGAAGAGGAAGGGWLLGAGPFGAKLAVGCLLALGVGAGCAALDGGDRASVSHHARRLADGHRRAVIPTTPNADPLDQLGVVAASAAGIRAGANTPLTRATRASREFGPEQALTGARPTAPTARPVPTARLASSASRQAATSSSGGDSTAAEREFSPG
jgi:RNA polymerase sigma factor (sigma-70 family)